MSMMRTESTTAVKPYCYSKECNPKQNICRGCGFVNECFKEYERNVLNKRVNK